jgi:large subunit ribosomal protein L30
MSAEKKIRVTQTKSVAGRLPKHKACIAGLGLRRIGHTVEVQDTPAVRGMIEKVYYMVRVEGEQ